MVITVSIYVNNFAAAKPVYCPASVGMQCTPLAETGFPKFHLVKMQTQAKMCFWNQRKEYLRTSIVMALQLLGGPAGLTDSQ